MPMMKSGLILLLLVAPAAAFGSQAYSFPGLETISPSSQTNTVTVTASKMKLVERAITRNTELIGFRDPE